MAKQFIFSEFTKPSFQMWEEQALKDLKGKGLDKLTWHTPEGFELLPYPFADQESAGFARGNAFNSMDTGWQTVQPVDVDDTQTALEITEEAISHGVPAFLLFSKTNNSGIPQYAAIWEKLDLARHAVHLQPSIAAESSRLSAALISYTKNLHLEDSLTGNIFTLLDKGIPETSQDTPWFRTAGIDLSALEAAGAGPALQLAVALSKTVDLFQHEADKETLALRLAYRFAIGSSFWMEVAKFRAFRMLIARVLEVIGVEERSPFIFAQTGIYNKSRYDAHTNMLRATTEATSAAFGGAHAIAVYPHNHLTGQSSKKDARLARNILQLMRHESYLHRVADPAGGSRYAEQVTTSLAQSAWTLFQEMEQLGGYARAGNFLDKKIAAANVSNIQEAATRKRTYVGINNYPSPEALTGLNNVVNDNRPIAAFERLRARLDAFVQNGNERPKAYIFMHGDRTWRNVRNTFARNVLGILGLDIHENTQPDNLEDSLEELRSAGPAVVCLCASDDDYQPDMIAAVRKKLPHAYIIIAGPEDEDLSVDAFIYRGVDVLSVLGDIVNKIDA